MTRGHHRRARHAFKPDEHAGRICANDTHLIAEMRATGLSPARIHRDLRTLTEGLK